MTVSFYLLLATLLPLAGFALLIFLGKRFAGLAGPFATLLALGSLGLSVAALVAWVAKPEFNQAHYVEATVYRWLPVPTDAVPAGLPDAPLRRSGDSAGASPAFSVGLLIDSLTVALFVLVTLIAALVHLYSIAYMAGDPRLPRYFAYLGLLTFSMLALLLANSLVQLLAFWQVLGIAAAMLIGFWFERRGPATASLKAVIVNHIGDAAFLLGLGILVYHVGAGGLTFYDAQGTSPLADSVRTLEKSEALLAWAPASQPVANFWASGVQSSEFLYSTGAGPHAFLGLHWLTWVGLLLFAGAAAKAAQFPLHIWLPDAAEAPAPVAPMIHSATMATAGIYLIARIYPILTMDARLAIAIIGCTTLLLGALISLVQTDIRKLLAYSTISQLGYIVLFLGAGGYSAGLLHLFTHALFKACLLLAAGSVLYALGQENDLRQMGGLWRKLPLTTIAFGLAALALIGTPFFSGGYSSQVGLAAVYQYAHALAAPPQAGAAMLLFYIPIAGAFITAFSLGRLGWLMFGGKSRNEEIAEPAQESFLMLLPIGILAALSLNLYKFFGLPSLILKSLPLASAGGPPRSDHHLEQGLEILVLPPGGYVFWAFLAAAPAVLIYWKGFGLAQQLRRLPLVNLLYLWLREKMFFETLYNGVLVRLTLLAAGLGAFVDRFVLDGMTHLVALLTRAVSRLCSHIDRRVVDGAVNACAQATRVSARAVLLVHTGRIRVYYLAMLTGLALLGGLLVLTVCRGGW